jgi:hypothetical protein
MRKYVAYAAVLGCAGILIGANGNWFNLGQNEKYVSDFSVKPNENKEVSIKAQRNKQVMFRVDVKNESMTTISREPYPITMTQLGTGKSISSYYGGTEFQPIGGNINLKISNTGEKEYKVLVVTVE